MRNIAKIVELQYNPYLPRLCILIDGKQPPEYSRLIQYTDEDIWKWNTYILDVIYSEVRDDFIVIFTGNSIDAQIIKYQCDKYKNCVGFKMKDFIVSDSLQKRLGMLNQVIKRSNNTMYKRTIIYALFILSPKMQVYLEDINNIYIENLFCSVRIITSIKDLTKYNNIENTFLFVITEGLDEGLKVIEKYLMKNLSFIIYLGKNSEFCCSDEKFYAFETTSNNLINTIFSCFLSIPLVLAFRNCINSLPNNIKMEDEIIKLSLIEPLIKIKLNNMIEVGKSNKIIIEYVPQVSLPPRVKFNVINSSIASTDDMCIYGKQAGNTKLEAYRYGEKKPFKVFEITVFKRNRIKKLILDDDELIIGVGDSKKLKYDYYPINADNSDSITWKSTDEMIATIDDNGILKGRKCGGCKIICIAENVSTRCICIVKPYLQDVMINIQTNENGEVIMEPLQEIPLNIQLIPEGCIDDELEFNSSNYDIVNIVNGILIAKNKGNAIVTVSNKTKRKSISIPIVVKKKKNSFLKSLFSKY